MINERYSINRVKRAMAHAERMRRRTKRVCGLCIDCRKWLGTWGPST